MQQSMVMQQASIVTMSYKCEGKEEIKKKPVFSCLWNITIHFPQ